MPAALAKIQLIHAARDRGRGASGFLLACELVGGGEPWVGEHGE